MRLVPGRERTSRMYPRPQIYRPSSSPFPGTPAVGPGSGVSLRVERPGAGRVNLAGDSSSSQLKNGQASSKRYGAGADRGRTRNRTGSGRSRSRARYILEVRSRPTRRAISQRQRQRSALGRVPSKRRGCTTYSESDAFSRSPPTALEAQLARRRSPLRADPASVGGTVPDRGISPVP